MHRRSKLPGTSAADVATDGVVGGAVLALPLGGVAVFPRIVRYSAFMYVLAVPLRLGKRTTKNMKTSTSPRKAANTISARPLACAYMCRRFANTPLSHRADRHNLIQARKDNYSALDARGIKGGMGHGGRESAGTLEGGRSVGRGARAAQVRPVNVRSHRLDFDLSTGLSIHVYGEVFTAGSVSIRNVVEMAKGGSAPLCEALTIGQ